MGSTQGVGGGDRSNPIVSVTGQVEVIETSKGFGRTAKHLYVDPKDKNTRVAFFKLDNSGSLFSKMKEFVLTKIGNYVVTEIEIKEGNETKIVKVAINVNLLLDRLGVEKTDVESLTKEDELGKTLQKVSAVYNHLNSVGKVKKIGLKDLTKRITDAKIQNKEFIEIQRSQLGSGTYGTVYKVDMLSLETIQIEQFAEKESHVGKKGALEDLKREYTNLHEIADRVKQQNRKDVLEGIQEPPRKITYKSMKHRNKDEQVGAMMGKVYQGDMFNEMNKMGTGEKIKAMNPLLKGLAFIQKEGLVHNDIKPENIFVDTNQNGEKVFRLADFGGAIWEKDLEGAKISYTATYSPFEDTDKKNPESFHRFGTFQMGVSLFHTLSGGKLPYPSAGFGPMGFQAPEKGLFNRGPLEEKGIPEDVIDFVALLCDKDPTKRPTGDAIRQKWQTIVDNHGGIEELAKKCG